MKKDGSLARLLEDFKWPRLYGLYSKGQAGFIPLIHSTMRLHTALQVSIRWISDKLQNLFFQIVYGNLADWEVPQWNSSGCLCFWVLADLRVCACVGAHTRMFSFSDLDHDPPPHWLQRSPQFFLLLSSGYRDSGEKWWREREVGGKKMSGTKRVGGGRREARTDGRAGRRVDGWGEWVDEVRRERCRSTAGQRVGVEGGRRLTSRREGILASSRWTGLQQKPAVTRPALPGNNQSFFTSNKIFLSLFPSHSAFFHFFPTLFSFSWHSFSLPLIFSLLFLVNPLIKIQTLCCSVSVCLFLSTAHARTHTHTSVTDVRRLFTLLS